MIFRIRLPRLEELLGLVTDDNERGKLSKPAYEPYEDPGGGYYYHVCSCICAGGPATLDGNFYGMFQP